MKTLFAWLYSGMAGASFVAVTQLATLSGSELRTHHLWAVGLFGVALPMLVVAAYVFRREPSGMSDSWWRLVKFLGPLGGGLFMAAMLSLFHSFNWAIGTAYFVSGLAVYILIVHPMNRPR